MSDKQNLIANTADTKIDLPEDDIDMLFAHLQQVEPPPSLIAHILAQTSQRTSVEIVTWTTPITGK